MSQVNLLPPEIRQGQAVRRRTTMIVVAGVGLIVLIGFFYFLQLGRLSGAREDLAAQQARNDEIRGEIAQLQPFADLEQTLAERQALVAELYLNEVSWSGALLDISRVIPDASVLTSLTGSLTAAAAPTDPTLPPPSVPGSLVGSMTFAGTASETRTISTWLTRLEQVEGWVNAWVSSAQESGARTRIYTFASGVDLTGDATTERGRGAPRP
jgi:Tfp pilus assembly protein PilN